MGSTIDVNCTFSWFVFVFLIGSISGSGILKRQVIGGDDANIKDFPYQVSIRLQGKHICGGTVISEKHVLTAAHCFLTDDKWGAPPPYNGYTANTGTSYSFKEVGYPHQFARLALHPRWIGTLKSSLINDIAVITLADRIIFGKRQKKVELPIQNVISGRKAYLTGWGRTSLAEDANYAEQMQQLEMKLLTYTECKSKVPIKMYNGQLCAYHRTSYGACVGDSGGPLVTDNKIVGIVSWTYDDKCNGVTPNIFTNVYAHLSFIEYEMNKR